jgi:hypothetical protein
MKQAAAKISGSGTRCQHGNVSRHCRKCDPTPAKPLRERLCTPVSVGEAGKLLADALQQVLDNAAERAKEGGDWLPKQSQGSRLP